MAWHMMAQRQFERQKIGAELSLATEFAEEGGKLDRSVGDMASVEVVEQIEIVAAQRQRGARLRADNGNAFPSEVGKHAQIATRRSRATSISPLAIASMPLEH